MAATPPDDVLSSDVLPQEDVQTVISEHLESIYPRLVQHARSKARRLPSVRGGELPNGQRAEDAVQTAVTQAWDWERKWNTRAYPDLIDFLSSAIDSIISNMVAGADHKHRGQLPAGWEPPADPSAFTLDKLADDECHDVLRRALRDVTADDALAREVMTAFMAGQSPGEIAADLSKDVEDVYNAIRKVKRRLAAALDEHPCWAPEAD